MKPYRIITISREFGSGGRSIGKAVAEKLGYAYYDNELVNEIAKRSGLSQSFIQDSGEYANAKSKLLFQFNNFGTGYQATLSDELYVIQRNLIMELAEEKPCVIVGRCADYILRERTDCFNVFVHADMSFRKQRIVELYGEQKASPEKRLAEKDKKRKTYYHYYTNQKWGLAQNYDLCLKSSTLGIDTCVDIITQFIIKSMSSEAHKTN